MARTSNVPSKTNEEVEAEVVPQKELLTLSALEYEEYSKKKGTIMGRKPDQKTAMSIEELRVLINDGWTPERVKAKHGLNDEELKQLVWKLSKAEQRERPIRFG